MLRISQKFGDALQAPFDAILDFLANLEIKREFESKGNLKSHF